MGIRLRAWRAGDALALAAAWEEEDIARYCALPPGRGRDQAEGWIAGCGGRADSGRALDLAVADVVSDRVLGEVGLTPFQAARSGPAATDVCELGWWVEAGERGRGVATAAVRLAAEWAAGAVAPARLVARIAPGHRPSERVAAAAGFTRRGRLDDVHDLWARPREPTPWGATVRV